MVELGLLAQAECLVISLSTFSDAARWRVLPRSPPSPTRGQPRPPRERALAARCNAAAAAAAAVVGRWGGSRCVRYVGRAPLTQRDSPNDERSVDEPTPECYAQFAAESPPGCAAAAAAAAEAALGAMDGSQAEERKAKAQLLDAAVAKCMA